MIDFVDIQYAQMLSFRLDGFRIKSTVPYKINFRCPLCGDSEKTRSKTRGWLIEKDNRLYYFCHNCGQSRSYGQFLKEMDIMIYNDWVAEKFIRKDEKPKKVDESQSIEDKEMHKAPVFDKDPLKKLKKISQLEWNHPLKKYINKRMVPPDHHYRMYYAPKFRAWINDILPGKFKIVGKDEPRLVLPFLDEDGKIFGCSARGFDPDGIRYYSIMFCDMPKLYGLDCIDFRKKYHLVEGAIDSMFLSNALAMAGADGNIKGLKNIQKSVWVYDAEPRNKDIHRRMEKTIEAGHQICIWPSNIPGKDINEMILNGVADVEEVINSNTYQGLTAKIKLTEWKKT